MINEKKKNTFRKCPSIRKVYQKFIDVHINKILNSLFNLLSIKQMLETDTSDLCDLI